MAKTKAETTPAQDRTVERLTADAELYGHTDASTETQKDGVVIFTAAGRRWPIRPNGTVDPAATVFGEDNQADNSKDSKALKHDRPRHREDPKRKATRSRPEAKRTPARGKQKGAR